MFSLAPLGDMTRFLRSTFRNEVYLITEDVCIKSSGILLAARSTKIEQMLEKGWDVPAVEFSDDMTGLNACLDLVYGGNVSIRENNFKTIYKFGKLFQICEMMKGVLTWIANDVRYDKFWSFYFQLKNLHDDINNSEFVVAVKRCLRTNGNRFLKQTTKMCRSQDKNSLTAAVELMSRIDDIRVFICYGGSS